MPKSPLVASSAARAVGSAKASTEAGEKTCTRTKAVRARRWARVCIVGGGGGGRWGRDWSRGQGVGCCSARPLAKALALTYGTFPEGS